MFGHSQLWNPLKMLYGLERDGTVETSETNLMKNPPPRGYSSGCLKARENPSVLSPGYM